MDFAKNLSIMQYLYLRVGAVGVALALVRSQAAGSKRIASGSVRTNAAIASVGVETLGARVARSFLALVDVQACSLRAGYETLAASTFSVYAGLVGLASGVRCAADLAATVEAELAWQTVTVAVADLDAERVLAVFALGAVRLGGALALAEASYALVPRWTVTSRMADTRDTHASLSRGRVTLEPGWTVASHCVIGTAADGVRSADVLLRARISAPVVYAGLIGRTISAVSAAEDADTVVAGLVGLTLGGRDAGNYAHVVDAFLSGRAVVDRTADGLALTVETISAVAVGVEGAVVRRSHATVLWTVARRHEVTDTTTHRLAVVHLADGVGTAGVLAGIDATMIVADGVDRTILAGETGTLGLAPGFVGIADVVRLALADRVVSGIGDADGARMTRIRIAGLDTDTLDVRHGVRLETRWTLADRTMIVGYADCVDTAGVLVAGVVTSVSEPVAELGRRTVDIVDARYALASVRHLVRVARVETGRTFANGLVIVDDAESVRTAGDEVAHWLASEHIFARRPACLILGTLSIGRAAILRRCLATVTIVRISNVAGQTLALSAMIVGDALRV